MAGGWLRGRFGVGLGKVLESVLCLSLYEFEVASVNVWNRCGFRIGLCPVFNARSVFAMCLQCVCMRCGGFGSDSGHRMTEISETNPLDGLDEVVAQLILRSKGRASWDSLASLKTAFDHGHTHVAQVQALFRKPGKIGIWAQAGFGTHFYCIF